VAGTTNTLVAINEACAAQGQERALHLLAELREHYEQFIQGLYWEQEQVAQARTLIAEQLEVIEQCCRQPYTLYLAKEVLAQGELISTRLFQHYLASLRRTAVLFPALNFMRLDANNEPDLDFLRDRLALFLDAYEGVNCLITQGYICCDAYGNTDNLRRGGSDYTATLIGSAIRADEIQIWTDIDGIHNNDPRLVSSTSTVPQVSYREAAELAYFGAKILHPTCVIPAEQSGIPIRLKNTFQPLAPGTLISKTSSGQQLTALAAKDGITAIKIRSGRMLNAYGFLRRVFQVFEDFSTPIDMITTSEVSVSLTIDDCTHLSDILAALGRFGEVEVDDEQAIVCLVGDRLREENGHAAQIFTALQDVPVRMVSYGGSDNNISILVPASYKKAALTKLQEALFSHQDHSIGHY